MARNPRFPDIVWYCDNCGTCLSSQKGFDDHKYTWKCKNCGYKNSISSDNINPKNSISTKLLFHLLGFLSFVGFWTSLMFGISVFALHATKEVYFAPFSIFLGLYLFSLLVTTVLQFTLRHKHVSAKNMLIEVCCNLKEDIFLPFTAIKSFLSSLLALIIHLIPAKKKARPSCNPKILIWSTFYVALLLTEIVVFNEINHLSAVDLWHWIQASYANIVELVSNLSK